VNKDALRKREVHRFDSRAGISSSVSTIILSPSRSRIAARRARCSSAISPATWSIDLIWRWSTTASSITETITFRSTTARGSFSERS